MKDLHAVKVLVDGAHHGKRLLLDYNELLGVQDVTMRFTRDALTEVTITLLSDQVTVEETPPREEPHVGT